MLSLLDSYNNKEIIVFFDITINLFCTFKTILQSIIRKFYIKIVFLTKLNNDIIRKVKI